jgi:hypothetical protein
MVTTVQQYLRIAEVYEKAAADKMATPEQHRTAFAHKAEWFRLRAQVKMIKDRALIEGRQKARLESERST